MIEGAQTTTEEAEADARSAGLRYVNDRDPGIRRKRAGKHFSYIGLDGRPIHKRDEVARIRALAIPPAWTDVWISPSPRGHIQATGRDARGRKQYRYHPRWRAVRDETKYHRMLEFGAMLPEIRAQVDRDLARHGFSREKVLATVVHLLEGTLIRVGNEEYARENRSYGLTTMRTRHVDVEGTSITFHFSGKSGVKHAVNVRDRRVATIVKRLLDLPGQHLFQYIDDDGELIPVESGDVNDYLRTIGGDSFSAKDFRTWAATLLAARRLDELGCADSDTEAKKRVLEAIQSVAQQLGNTPTVCRTCYIHPEIISAYLEGVTIRAIVEQSADEVETSMDALEPEEAAMMLLLRQRCETSSTSACAS